jgi:hypothetical protein
MTERKIFEQERTELTEKKNTEKITLIFRLFE